MSQVSWPVWRQEEFIRNQRSGQIGNKLVSDTQDVRVWLIDLAPGQRLPFHCHVLNYFWTATAPGRTRSHYSDGRVSETIYKLGDTRHFSFAEGERMIHDLENIGDERLTFTTVELKIGSANKPLPLAAQTG